MKPDQMPSNTPPGSGYWHHPSGQRTVAVRIRPDNRQQVAAWVGGHPWAAGVIVPTADGGEQHANTGDWVVARADGWWAIWTADLFAQQWRPEVET